MEVVEAPQRFSGSLQPGHDLFLHCFPGEETDKDKTMIDQYGAGLEEGRGRRRTRGEHFWKVRDAFLSPQCDSIGS